MKRDDQTPGKDPDYEALSDAAKRLVDKAVAAQKQPDLTVLDRCDPPPETERKPRGLAALAHDITPAQLKIGEPGDHLGNAEKLVFEMPDRFAWTPGPGWRAWIDGEWITEDGDEILEQVISKAVFQGGGERGRTQGNVDSIKAASRKHFKVAASKWNSDPNIAGLPDGKVLEIATGEIRDARHDDFVTMTLACAPEERDVSLWHSVLDHALQDCGGDKAKAALRIWMRNVLRGETDPQDAIVFLQGKEGTSKSTIAKTLKWLVGGYAHSILGKRLVGRGSEHTQWLASCEGKRLVVIPEIPKGAFEAEELNSLADGESMEANKMRQDSMVFESHASILMHSNNRPSASNPGLYRRLKVLSMNRQPEVVDRQLGRKLREIGPGILHWILGAGDAEAEWPAEVVNEVAVYKLENDPVGLWLEEGHAALKTGASENTKTVRDAFNEWHRENGGQKDWSNKALTAALKNHGVVVDRTTRAARASGGDYIGITLSFEPDQPPADDAGEGDDLPF